MNFRTAVALLVIGLMVFSGSARADEPATSTNSQRFEALKKLAGDWVEVDKDGKPTDHVITSFRLTAAGTVLHETVYPGTDDEMVTMYHLDGSDLVLTHYCSFGNQPKMCALPGDDVHRIDFKLVAITNLKSNDDERMDQATLTFDGKNRFTADWGSSKDGKPCHRHAISLARKQK